MLGRSVAEYAADAQRTHIDTLNICNNFNAINNNDKICVCRRWTWHMTMLRRWTAWMFQRKAQRPGMLHARGIQQALICYLCAFLWTSIACLWSGDAIDSQLSVLTNHLTSETDRLTDLLSFWDSSCFVCRYDERIDRVETRITARLRDQLGTARNANEMFRIFSRYNALFVRPHIRGAIREYQTQLIQRVKDDIESLHEKFKVTFSY